MRLPQAAAWAGLLALAAAGCAAGRVEEPVFRGRHFAGTGDVEYLELLDTARRMLRPDPEFQSLSMLYAPAWNGFVEGPTWDAWWIQNSYGTTYGLIPFLEEPYRTFLQNAQDLWFDQMGDGRRRGLPGDIVAPDGSLCDCASPGRIIYKQGDGRTDIHDWGFEFTAAGVVLQADLLLMTRDAAAAGRYLPKLERAMDFVATRLDPETGLFLVGAAANLLAPSYAGWKRAEGVYDKACLAGLSVTAIAALDRLIELEKAAGAADKAGRFASLRDRVRAGLPRVMTEDGYFIKSLDPDGTRHGVYGAEKHGYFEASPNHDAVAFRVVDDARAKAIMDKMASIPGLRPHDFILPNYPSLDDMYEAPEGLWEFGRWVNGGHWSTCEARMILAYCRVGRTEDARRSMKRILTFARRFRMDNPLTEFGNNVYQPKEPINITYDAFGPATALLRGLFEYVYAADSLTLVPHVPAGITSLRQLDPVRWGGKRLSLSTRGTGPVTAVSVNGREWAGFDARSIRFAAGDLPGEARIEIALGGAERRFSPVEGELRTEAGETALRPPAEELPGELGEALRSLEARAGRFQAFELSLEDAGLGGSYEAAHAGLIREAVETSRRRFLLIGAGKIAALPEPSRSAADRSYIDAAIRLCDGLEKALAGHENSADPRKAAIFELWTKAGRN